MTATQGGNEGNCARQVEAVGLVDHVGSRCGARSLRAVMCLTMMTLWPRHPLCAGPAGSC